MTANWKNRTVWAGDNLNVMRGMNSASVNLIYLDPPFNSNRDYAAPIGSEAAGAAFKDTWTLSDVDEAWHGEIADRQPALYAIIAAAGLAHGKGMKSYLIMMAVRLLEMRRLLKPTGSIYLHCDPTASHYLKMLMDAVFGRANYRNEIVWCYTGPGSPGMRQFNRKHDTIHWYSMGDAWTFNGDAVRISHDGKTKDNFKAGLRGSGFVEGKYDLAEGKIPETWWAQAKGNGLAIASRQKNQYVGYPTQKPIALLDRIIRASSNEDDMVLDPFCGCATALVAADRLNRQWAGIDLSPLAARLVLKRLRGDQRIAVRRCDPSYGHTPAHRPWRSPELPYAQAHALWTAGRGVQRLPHAVSVPQPHRRPRGATVARWERPPQQPPVALRCLQLHERHRLPRAAYCPINRTGNTTVTKPNTAPSCPEIELAHESRNGGAAPFPRGHHAR